MIVTVLICTRNQASSLVRTLSSIAEQEVAPDISWRVVVVNNGSSDDTSHKLDDFAEIVDLQVVDEPGPGLSRARNTGISTLTRGYVLCTDDDVTVPSDWINSYARAFREHPEAGFFGSGIAPHLPEADPRWAKAAVTAAPSCFARFCAGPTDKRIDAATPERFRPFGANMAFRVDVLKQFRFDETLGRQPDGVVLSGEETKLIGEMLAAGHVGYLIPANPVRHWITPPRQTLEYIRQYYYGQGWLQASNAMKSASPLWRIDQICSQAAAGLFQLARTVAGWVPLETLTIWVERQYGHFSGRAAAFRKNLEA